MARSLVGHEVAFARRIGWHELGNGQLIEGTEKAGFHLLLTTDKNIRYQQNLTGRTIAIVVLRNPQWPSVRLCLDPIADTINSADAGSYTEVEIPHQV